MPDLKRKTVAPTTKSSPAKRLRIEDEASTTVESISYAACHAALLTTEILEEILTYSSMRDLLLSQRVNQKWMAVIAKSETLQQNLFFKPRKARFCWKAPFKAWKNYYDDLIKIDVDYKLSEAEIGTHYQIWQNAEINSLILDLAWSDGVLRSHIKNLSSHRVYFRKNVLRKFGDKEASWRRMFITQPPDPKLFVHGRCYHCDCEDLEDDCFWDIERPPGAIKAGDIECAIANRQCSKRKPPGRPEIPEFSIEGDVVIMRAFKESDVDNYGMTFAQWKVAHDMMELPRRGVDPDRMTT